MRRWFISFLSCLSFAGQAAAMNKDLWDVLTTDQQGAYLIGAFEMILTGEPNAPLQQYKQTLWQCYEQEKFDVQLMLELVQESYESSFWRHSNQENVGAGLVLQAAMTEYCIAKGFEFD